MNNHPLFAKRIGVIATMHHKEKVMAPLLEQELGIQALVPPSFNTDSFGTFTREVKRIGTQVEAARLKAQTALAITGETLAFASEGTFGPHPAIPFIASNREIVILLDRTNDLEIIGQEISTETNYSHKIVDSVSAAYAFAQQVGFPIHALVVMTASPQDQGEIIKGITTAEQLEDTVKFALKKSPDSKAHLETDMRALYNPTRMKIIEKATRKLIEKIKNTCPKCACPGFEVIQRKQGLPCACCNLPTALTRAAISKCKKCGFTQETLFPNAVEKADPSQCKYCNP